MSDYDLKFDREFKISTKASKINRSNPFDKRDKFWHVQAFISCFSTCTCLIFLNYSIIYHDYPNEDYGELVKNGIVVIVSTSVLLKYFILIHHRTSLITLIEKLESDYEMTKYFNIEDKSIVLNYIQKGKGVCKVWLVIAIGASVMFPLKALILMVYYYVKGEFRLVSMYDMNYPEIINAHKYEPFIYFILLLLTFSFNFFAMTIYITFDPLVPIFMLHMCGQLDILAIRIIKVFQNNNPEGITENLKNINIKLEAIYRFIQIVQNIFTVQYEYNLKTTTFLIPFAAFQVVQSLKNYEFNLEFVFFFLGAIVLFYYPCYYSDLLMKKSGQMREAIYSSGWQNNTNIKYRKIILFMLTRTTNPLVIRTIFYPICLDTFAEMCRQAYAIYNLMQATWG